MSPGKISRRIAVDRLALVDEYLTDIESLPLKEPDEFFSDRRNVWTAESCLRRSLEALLDLGRHILAKVYGEGVGEYKEVALRLGKHEILPEKEAELLRILAGYRNRLVHFYHEVSQEELYGICAHQLGDVKEVRNGLRDWLGKHPEKLDDLL